MNAHPLLELANDASVKHVASFRETADGLTGEQLADMYSQERETAAAEANAEIQHFLDHDGTIEGAAEVTEQEFAIAILNQCRQDDATLKVDEEADFTPLDYQIPLTTLAARKIKARHRVISQADMLCLSAQDQLCVARIRLMPPGSTKGDTPLRALLEGLAVSATVDGWRSTLEAQIGERFERSVADGRPNLLVLANNRYWEIYRKRSLKSAGPWMAAMRRLQDEIDRVVEVRVDFVSFKLYGDPPWRVRKGQPFLDADPVVRDGLHPVGDELRPKSKSRAEKEAVLVEADDTRAPRAYSIRDTYWPGDRIQHPKLGTGVVQKALGENKVEVLFDGEAKVLVQGRG